MGHGAVRGPHHVEPKSVGARFWGWLARYGELGALRRAWWRACLGEPSPILSCCVGDAAAVALATGGVLPGVAVAAQTATRICDKVEGVDARCLAPFVIRTGADVWGMRGTTAASLGRSVRAILLAAYPETAKNLSKLGIACELYCLYAFSTLFSAASMPPEEYLRLLDIFFYERSAKVLVRFAVAFWGEYTRRS